MSDNNDWNPFSKKSKGEPMYVPDGEEFGKPIGQQNRPKWMIAKTPFQKDILSAVDKTYFQDHNERSAVLAIERSMMSLASGVISVYPTEWVTQCIDWVRRKRKDGQFVNFSGLINLINNSDRRMAFVAKWGKEHPDVSLRKDATNEAVTPPQDENTYDLSAK